MSVTFFDLQNKNNPVNGTIFANDDNLIASLREMQSREPFFCEIIGNENKLTIGIGPHKSCAQYSALSGDPPYLMAIGDNSDREDGELSFLIDDIATPVPCRYALSSNELWTVIDSFVKTEEPNSELYWEEI